MRDDKWLFAKLDQIWDKYFPDIPQDNDVRIVWGRRARSRLGSIREIPAKISVLNSKIKNISQVKNSNTQKFIRNSKLETRNSIQHPETIITINSLFRDTKIPEYVVTGTIAHELSHYAHGFHSPLEKKYETPHAGGVVRHEMRRRGLEKILKAQKIWLKNNWQKYVDVRLPRKTSRRRKASRRIIYIFK